MTLDGLVSRIRRAWIGLTNEVEPGQVRVVTAPWLIAIRDLDGDQTVTVTREGDAFVVLDEHCMFRGIRGLEDRRYTITFEDGTTVRSCHYLVKGRSRIV